MNKRKLPVLLLITPFMVLILALSTLAVAPRAHGQADPGPAGPLALEDCTLTVGLGEAAHEVPARCGALQVPENRAEPEGRMLTIQVIVLPATNPDATGAPIFHLEGGPGGSAITAYAQTWNAAYEVFRAEHDIVLMDQRGTGRSTSLQCTEAVEAAFPELAETLGPEERRSRARAQLTDCLERLSATTDPANYTSAALADDINAVREALGYEQINLFGSSYGTWLAQFYLARHGETVHAAVLEGVTGPWNHHFLFTGANIEQSLNRVLELCAADAGCNATFPDLRSQMEQTLARLAEAPVTTSGVSLLTGGAYPVTLDQERYLSALALMLDTSSTISIIPQAIAMAASGNYWLLAAILVSVTEQIDSVSVGLFESIICAEAVPFITETEMAEAMQGALYGVGDDLIRDVFDGCTVWRSAELDAADVAPIESDRPVLLFAGGFDTRTPVRFAEETASRLSDSTLVVFPYQGHGILPLSGCAQTLATTFFADPTAALDTSCAASDPAPVFIGTVSYEFVPYSDPAGAFEAMIPAGWLAQPTEATSLLSWFVSPPEQGLPQELALGLAGELSPEVALLSAEAVLTERYGSLANEGTVSMLGTTVAQYHFTYNGTLYNGGLIVAGLGATRPLLWYAAPSSMFVAGFTAVSVDVLTSLLR